MRFIGRVRCGENEFRSECNLLLDILSQSRDRNANLLHCIAVTHGHAAVLDGIKVVGDAERSTDLILTAIALADRAGIVVIDHEVLGKLGIDLACTLGELFRERKNSSLVGRKCGMEMQHDAGIVLFCVDDLLVVSVDKEREKGALYAE